MGKSPYNRDNIKNKDNTTSATTTTTTTTTNIDSYDNNNPRTSKKKNIIWFDPPFSKNENVHGILHHTFPPHPQEDGGDNFIKPWGTLHFHLPLYRPSPTDQKLLIPPTGNSLPSRLTPPNFYSPHHQMFIPPSNPLNLIFLLKLFFS